jgi:UDP:flavonoid glycosyltransferase YjiC (YdhE family)
VSRFLLVVPPFTGHVTPLVGVAEELRGRGHDVAWVGDGAMLTSLLRGAWPVYDCGPAPLAPRPPELRGFAALQHLWENVLVPLTESMEPVVCQAVRRSQPDVVICDQQALAGALVAERFGIPWATSASTSAELLDPLAAFPIVRDWLVGLLTDLRQRFGNPASPDDPRFSPYLIIAFTTAELASEPTGPVRFVGPARQHHVGNGGFPWDRLDPRRKPVLVTMGTVNTDAVGPFLRECVLALRSRPQVQGVFADPADLLRDFDDEILRMRWLPQQALLPNMAVVVCHAGHNTVCESLAHGVPLVVAPIRDDQPMVAEQVVASGAGLRLRFSHARAAHIGEALDRVLKRPVYAAAARRVQDSFAAAGGAHAAAEALEDLAHWPGRSVEHERFDQ